MKKVISLFAIIILSAIAGSAQTGPDKTSSNDGSIEKASTRSDKKDDPRVLRVGPSTTYISKGLTTDDVVRVLGKPEAVSERMNGDTRIVLYTYPRGEGRFLVTEFENDLLVRSYIDTPAFVAQLGDSKK
jgi:hypothetical protein